VNINRDQSSNNYLKTLLTSAGEFDKEFNKYENKYEITVTSDVTKLPLIIEPEDKSAKYQVLQNSNFVTGKNIVIIRVTAENGEQRDYKIVVNKEPSENDYLLNIITNHGSLDPKFKKEITEYTVEVENEVQNIEIKAVKEDKASTVRGERSICVASWRKPSFNSCRVRKWKCKDV
ncbi:MAG: cadherin-like beta sandwich domain-containing protein, partial [Clostridia bacterium]|nr:cadherin-like beta sandwich domain-containing protein [Clostridia bacterium]